MSDGSESELDAFRLTFKTIGVPRESIDRDKNGEFTLFNQNSVRLSIVLNSKSSEIEIVLVFVLVKAEKLTR